MSNSNSSSGGGGGCGCGCGGCVMLILFVLLFWSIWFGLPIGDKTWNIDLFPPRIWEMKEIPIADVPAAKASPTSVVNSTDSPVN